MRRRTSLNLVVRRHMKPRRSIFRTVVAPIVTAAAFVPTLGIAVWAVARGRGAVSYANFYGLAIPYTSVLIIIGALFLRLAVAYIGRIVYNWREGHDGAAKLRTIQSPAAPADPGDGK